MAEDASGVGGCLGGLWIGELAVLDLVADVASEADLVGWPLGPPAVLALALELEDVAGEFDAWPFGADEDGVELPNEEDDDAPPVEDEALPLAPVPAGGLPVLPGGAGLTEAPGCSVGTDPEGELSEPYLAGAAGAGFARLTVGADWAKWSTAVLPRGAAAGAPAGGVDRAGVRLGGGGGCQAANEGTLVDAPATIAVLRALRVNTHVWIASSFSAGVSEGDLRTVSKYPCAEMRFSLIRTFASKTTSAASVYHAAAFSN